MESSGFGLSEAVEDHTPDSDSHYDGSLKNMITVATGFVMEALDKGDLNIATSLLTQMVISQSVVTCTLCDCFLRGDISLLSNVCTD